MSRFCITWKMLKIDIKNEKKKENQMQSLNLNK